jgi:DNA-binding beta-propeller fold protein YncE
MKLLHVFAACLSLASHANTISVVEMDGKLKEPFGTEFDAKGNAWIVEMISGNRLFRLDDKGGLTHVAGRTEAGYSGDGGPALEAQFNGPHNLAVLPDGNVILSDTWNGVTRHVDVSANVVSTVKGYAAEKGKERSTGPYCVTLGWDGKTVFIANLSQVLTLDLITQELKAIAGNGKKGVPQEGALALESPLVDPRAAAPDRQGNLYILERNGNALRVVDQQGRIRTVVNASGKKGGTGDGGLALDATLNGPKHLCVDVDDTVIIADAENHLIRRFDPKSGIITRIAGTGKKGASGVGGDPLKWELARPHGVTIHPQTKELWITDTYNDRILKITKN